MTKTITRFEAQPVNPYTLTQLSLGHVRTDGGTQPRVQLNESVVADYAEALTEGAKLPPVTVFFDGSEHWIADGFHRYHAHRKIDAVFIDAEVREGTRRDAVLYSVGANETHGLRRTNEDKRRAVETLLKDAEWTTWSDHQIAKACGVSHPFVGKLRADLSSNGYKIPTERTVERNGTTYQQDTTNVGGKKIEKPSPATHKPDEPEDNDEPASEVEALRAELAELKSQYDELLSQYKEVVADNASMAAVFEADDKVTAAVAEAKKNRELYRIEKERITGLMNENAELNRLVKSWRRKAEKSTA